LAVALPFVYIYYSIYELYVLTKYPVATRVSVQMNIQLVS
jgi:hypothetical protein